MTSLGIIVGLLLLSIFSLSSSATRLCESWLVPGHRAVDSVASCTGSFSCHDGSGEVPFSKVDDGYCDCGDKSDESGDCNDMPQLVPLYKFDTDVKPTPEMKKTLLRAVDQGREAMQYLHMNLQKGIEYRSQLRRTLEVEQSAGKKSQAELMPKIQQLHFLDQQLAAVHTILDSPPGPNNIFLGMFGHCIDSKVVEERYLKGATATVVGRAYILRLCPLQNVTQIEFAPKQWAEAERAINFGHHAVFPPRANQSLAETVADASLDISREEFDQMSPREQRRFLKRREKLLGRTVESIKGDLYQVPEENGWGDEIHLGDFKGWIDMKTDEDWERAAQFQNLVIQGEAEWNFKKKITADDLGKVAMVYEGGPPCGHGDEVTGIPYRTVQVRMLCGGVFPGEIVRAREDGICSYLLDFQTPIACPWASRLKRRSPTQENEEL